MVSYAPYILLQIYTITILATFRVTIFEFFHPGPQPISYVAHETLFCNMSLHNKASHSATYGKRLPPIFYVSNLVLFIETSSNAKYFDARGRACVYNLQSILYFKLID